MGGREREGPFSVSIAPVTQQLPLLIYTRVCVHTLLLTQVQIQLFLQPTDEGEGSLLFVLATTLIYLCVHALLLLIQVQIQLFLQPTDEGEGPKLLDQGLGVFKRLGALRAL